jgi:hypothetical protein
LHGISEDPICAVTDTADLDDTAVPGST